MADIVFEHVTKRYSDGFEAVKGLDLTVADGEFLVLVGPSGCGKSTALRMVAGLEDVSGGVLKIGGRIVNALAPRDRNIAMVFQSYALYPHLSVRDNIGFGLRVRGMPRDEIRRRVEEVARVLELDVYLDRKPAQLSGGQRQRVAMGRAIVREPNAFLMDEPLSNLDAKLRVAMRAEVTRLQRLTGTTTIYVTHDQVEAMTMGDRVAVLNKGVLQQLDTPKALYRQPANLFVAGFIGSPAMNLALCPVTAESDCFVLLLDGQRVAVGPGATMLATHAGREVVAGIRPEHLWIAPPDAQPGFDARVTLVEELGASLLVHLSTGRDLPALPLAAMQAVAPAHGALSLVASIDGDAPVKAGDAVRLRLAPDKIHFFDPTTGAALRAAEPSPA
jgi:multiple sugar transport system ATP-binding protein